jgi:hypothetical protein
MDMSGDLKVPSSSDRRVSRSTTSAALCATLASPNNWGDRATFESRTVFAHSVSPSREVKLNSRNSTHTVKPT